MVHKHPKAIRTKYDSLKQAQKRILERKVKDERKNAQKKGKKFNFNKPAVLSKKSSKKKV